MYWFWLKDSIGIKYLYHSYRLDKRIDFSERFKFKSVYWRHLADLYKDESNEIK